MPGCLLALFIGIVFILFSFFSSIFRLFMGVKQTVHNAMGGQTSRPQTETENAEAAGRRHSHRRPSGRFFDKDEGEYVDFEEL